MPSHWSSRRLHIVTPSSATATQCLHAIGCAEAGRYFSHHPEAAGGKPEAGWGDYRDFKDVAFHDDEVVYVSIGEGSTSQGEFWESLNTASNGRLPVVYVVEDNEYAISTPVEVNTPGGNISRLIANFPNFHFAEIDGTDPHACYAAMVEAVAYARSGRGPALVHGHVVRPYSHSLSDDERQYRSEEEVQAEMARDPLARMQMWLLREGILDADGINRLEQKVDEEVHRAADRVLQAVLPTATPEAILRHQYSEDLKPTDVRYFTEKARTADPAERTMAELINLTLKDEMRRDPRIVVFGEDVADATRDEALRAGKLKGKGGVFKLTAGLQSEFGSDRCWNSPLAEANIMGRAIGMAVRGLKPVVEIQFFDYIWPAMHQMRNELPLVRWRSHGEWSFTHTPGVRIVMPSNALDAMGLLRTAIRCDDPVLFLEHKRLYRETFGRGMYPGAEYAIPFGKAKIVRQGSALSVITYGALVPRALQAAEKLQRETGIEVELIDLRSLAPYDWETIAASVRKTSKAIVAHEDMLSWGYGAEIAARIGDELFDDLDAPVRRVASMDTFVAYQPILEEVILPQPEDLYRAMLELAKY
jgi:2-oxoisovalerate dehydrogenase E1 component